MQWQALYYSPFQSLGMVPVSRLFWKIMAKNVESSVASSFIILAGNTSGPVDLLGFSFCSNFRAPSSVTLIYGIAGNGVPSGVRMLLQSSLVFPVNVW